MTSDRTPKVSVIVPVMNVEPFVEQCVRSLMRQTLEDIEIIIVDDGSTDRSGAICDALAAEDARIRVIHKANAGYGAAVNTGFDAARGEYLGILESDDFCDVDAYELLYNAAKQADADVAKAQFFLYWKSFERADPFPFFAPDDCGHVLSPFDADYVFNLKASIWSAIYRASFLREKGIRLHETPGASYQDSPFNFMVFALAERATFLEERLFFYRQDNEGSSVNSRHKAFVIFGEYDFMEEFLEAHADHPRIERLWQLLALMRHDAYLWNYDRVDPSYHAELAERMAADFARDARAGRYRADLIDARRWRNISLLARNPEKWSARYDAGELVEAGGIAGKIDNARTYISGLGLGPYLSRAAGKYLSRSRDEEAHQWVLK